jgi:2-C-methyl-D-erythritol 4-phosphate cytidylyltransferase
MDLIAFVDAARPLSPPGFIDSLVSQMSAAAGPTMPAGVVPAVRVFDTVRRVGPDGHSLGVVDRDAIRAVQTPQLMCRQCITAAYAAVDAASIEAVTDDAAALELSGGPVLVVPGDPRNFKITVASDLRLAEALINFNAQA